MSIRRQHFLAIVLLVYALSMTSVHAQDFSNVGKGEAIKVTGGINASSVFYGSNGIDQRRDPFNYYLNGNLNFNIYGNSVPFNFSYSNQQAAFRQPFNQFRFRPKYKWISAQIGTASMSFSPYSLSGHTFNGIGLDLDPFPKWKFGIMYGRLLKGIEGERNELGALSNDPAFSRKGFGIKSTYKAGSDNLDLIFFYAKDDDRSIDYDPNFIPIDPQENLVISIGGSKQIGEKLSVKAEVATSAITRNVLADESSIQPKGLGQLINSNASTRVYQAISGGVNYQLGGATIGLNYQRVDPGYETLGAYYFNQDLENINTSLAFGLLQQKLNISLTGGLERNNLDDDKLSEMKRVVGSINATMMVSQKVNVTGSYSNFSSYTNIRNVFDDQVNAINPYQLLDTLNFTQISQSANVGINYNIEASESVMRSVNVQMSWQQAAEKQNGKSLPAGSTVLNFNTAYIHSLNDLGMNISAIFNWNQNEAGLLKSSTYGPTLAVSKTLFEKKLNTNLSTSWNQSAIGGQVVNGIVNVRAGGSYTFLEKHNLNLGITLLSRKRKQESGPEQFSETTATLSYSFSF